MLTGPIVVGIVGGVKQGGRPLPLATVRSNLDWPIVRAPALRLTKA